MIAVNIGKTFLRAYNEKYECHYTAKEFFVKEYFPLFFDHEKYMQWITNSPFVQGIKKGKLPTPVERKEKLETLQSKISGNAPDASIAIGFPSLDPVATTSGQVTGLELPLHEEEAYLSWIGGGFGIGIKGGLSLLFNDKDLLLDLFQGWKIYRDYLNNTSELRGNQINTWNGQWIAHRYNEHSYDESDPTASFAPFDSTKEGGVEVKTINWTEVLIGLARQHPDALFTGYVYSLGQTNITIGFIPFNLPRIKCTYDLYEKYFGTSNNDQVRNLFGTEIGFTKACQMGSIGVNALEPKGFRNSLSKGELPKYTEEKEISFKTYQIWLLAMLNNEELWEKATQFAEILHAYATSDKKAKTGKSQQVKNLLMSVNQSQFIERATDLVKESEDTHALDQMVHLVNGMPLDNVPYFLTLLRFKYAVIDKLNN